MVATVWLEKQWLAVSRYGVPELVRSLSNPPVHTAPPPLVTKNSEAIAFFALVIAPNVEEPTQVASTRHVGASCGRMDFRFRSTSSSTSEIVNEAAALFAGTSTSR